MDLLIDECVPKSVSDVFATRGHTTIFVVGELGQSAPDRLVAETANEQKLIVITWNVRDFEKLGISRRPPDNQQKFRYAGMISFLCAEAQGARRAQQLMESIEFDYKLAMGRPDKRLLMKFSRTIFKFITESRRPVMSKPAYRLCMSSPT
jgi:hypothetical protein